MRATPITSAPASRAASTAVSGLAPVVDHVLDDDDPASRRRRSLDPALHAVLLLRLRTTNESIVPPAGVEHGGADRIGTERSGHLRRRAPVGADIEAAPVRREGLRADAT